MTFHHQHGHIQQLRGRRSQKCSKSTFITQDNLAQPLSQSICIRMHWSNLKGSAICRMRSFKLAARTGYSPGRLQTSSMRAIFTIKRRSAH